MCTFHFPRHEEAALPPEREDMWLPGEAGTGGRGTCLPVTREGTAWSWPHKGRKAQLLHLDLSPPALQGWDCLSKGMGVGVQATPDQPDGALAFKASGWQIPIKFFSGAAGYLRQ